MSTDQTTNIGLPFVMPAQAQKHVTVNESLTRLDALVQLTAESRSVSAEPGSPGDGQIWILPAGKTGAAWGGYGNWALGYYRDGAWEQLTPKEGWRAWVKDEGVELVFDGAGWAAAAPPAWPARANLNGGFEVWQRGASDRPDMWSPVTSGGGTHGYARGDFTIGQTDVPGEPEHYFRWTVSGTTTSVPLIETPIEDVRRLAGRRVLVSLYLRANVARSVTPRITQDFGSGGSSSVNTNGAAMSVTTAWQGFAVEIDAPSISGLSVGAGSYLALRLFGEQDVTDQWIDIAQVQIQPWPEGAAAPPSPPAFERRPVAIEEAACKRYYERLTAEAAYNAFGAGVCLNSTKAFVHVDYAPKRVAPSFTSGGGFEVNIGSAQPAVTSFSGNYVGARMARLGVNTAGSLAADKPALLQASNDASAYIEFNAEL